MTKKRMAMHKKTYRLVKLHNFGLEVSGEDICQQMNRSFRFWYRRVHKVKSVFVYDVVLFIHYILIGQENATFIVHVLQTTAVF